MGGRAEQVIAAMRRARLMTLEGAVRHHEELERSFLRAAAERPDEAIAWELAAEEQRGLAAEQRRHLAELGALTDRR
jgi:hypothetical protein